MKGVNETKKYNNLIESGLELLSKAQSYIDTFDHNRVYGPSDLEEVSSSFDIVEEYHNWVKSIIKFYKSDDDKDKILTSFFKEVDGVPTLDWLEDNHYMEGDPMPASIATSILTEGKKKLEYIRKIYGTENVGNDKKIILLVNKKTNEITVKDKNHLKHSFRRTYGINKRLGYLIKIYKTPKIGGAVLAGTPKLQNISKELKKINADLMEDLDLQDNVIMNDNNSGYYINPKYIFEFT